MVETEFLEQEQAFLDSTRISGSPESAERVVVGNTFEDDLSPIEFQSEVRRKLKLTDAKARAHAVSDAPISMSYGDLSSIEIRVVDIPAVDIGQMDG